MERRTNLGIEYSNLGLHVDFDVYPKNFHFFEEGHEQNAKRKDLKGKIVGTVSACYPGGADGKVLFVREGGCSIEAVHKSTVIYERKFDSLLTEK